jgi:Icc-related predicted phosphoesterase
MTRVLGVSDEVHEPLYGEFLRELDPDVIVSCGDLPFDYLEYLVTVANVPLVWVPGNHDPSLRREGPGPPNPLRPGYLDRSHAGPVGPPGGINIDGRIIDVAGLRVAGVGGSLNYNDGPHQYTEAQMRRRAARLQMRARLARIVGRRRVDLFVTHIPPAGYGDDPEDPAHRGAQAFLRLLLDLRPTWMLHGHMHPHEGPLPDRSIGTTHVVNVVPFRLLEVET